MIPFNLTAQGLAVTAAEHDMFSLKASTNVSIAIRRVFLGQYSDAADAEADVVGVRLIRGHTTAPSGGAAATPVPLDPRRAAFGTFGTGEEARVNDTTIAADGTGVLVVSETFNIMAGWYWRAPDGDHLLPRSKSRSIWLDPGDRIVLRMVAPTSALTMNLTVDFDEMELHDVLNK